MILVTITFLSGGRYSKVMNGIEILVELGHRQNKLH